MNLNVLCCTDYSKLRVLVKFLRQVTKTFLVIEPRPELTLKLFLNFGKFEPRCSYKVVLIKKKSYSVEERVSKLSLALPARGRYGAPLRCTMATSGQSERCFSTSGKVTKLRCQTWMKHASGEAKTRSKMKRKWSKILVPIFYLWILVQYCDRRIIVLRCCVHFGVIERDYSG